MTVIRTTQKPYPGDERLSKMQIHRLVRRFQQTGSVEDMRHANSGRSITSRSAENIEEVTIQNQETPQKSVRSV